MKVVGFNGSPRKDGNTGILIHRVFHVLEKEGIETELVQLSHKRIHGCIACYKCVENKDQRCAVDDDAANEYIEKMTQAQGVVLGSPVYFLDVTPEMKALIDRVGLSPDRTGGCSGTRLAPWWLWRAGRALCIPLTPCVIFS